MSEPTPLTSRHWLAVLAIPVGVLLLTGVLATLKGPFWLSPNLDPDYAYLLNGLNLAEGKLVGHVDHPGTPVQIGVSCIIRSVATLSGNGAEAARRRDVLTHPEVYLAWCARLFALFFFLALSAVGALTLWYTRAIRPALAAQAAAVLATQMPLALTCVKPEPVLATLSVCVAAVTLLHLFGKFQNKDARAALLFGALAGLGVATKVTFLPLLILPLIVLRGIWPRLLYALTLFVAFYLATLPIHVLWDTMMDWFTKLVTHTGVYGSGASGFFDPLAYVRGLGAVLSMELPFTLLLLGGALLLVLSRHAPRTEELSALRRALLGVIAAEALQIVMVARHPWNGAHYLVPALGLMGLNVVLILLLIPHLPQERTRLITQRVFTVGMLCAALYQCVQFVRSGAELRDNVRQVAQVDSFVKSIPGATVAGYYSCSSERYALQFGNRFALANYSGTLQELYPDDIFYHQWFRMFVNYRGGIPDRDIAAHVKSGTLLLRGWDLAADFPTDEHPSPLFPPGTKLELLFKTPCECVYRVTTWPDQ